MDENIATLIAQVSRMIRRNFDARAREIGVTRPQWQVLSLLNHHAGIHQGGLADILEVEPITAGRMIDRLQEAGLVERRPDPADRRAWRLFLTERGSEQLDRLRPFAREALSIALEGVAQEDIDRTTEVLVRMRANLVRRAAPADAPQER